MMLIHYKLVADFETTSFLFLLTASWNNCKVKLILFTAFNTQAQVSLRDFHSLLSEEVHKRRSTGGIPLQRNVQDS